MSTYKKLAKIEWGFQKIVHDYLISETVSFNQAKNKMENIYKEESDKYPKLKQEIKLIFQDYTNTIEQKNRKSF